MNEGLAEIERAIVQVDFELLNKSLTGKTPEFCSKALRWAVDMEWKTSSLVNDSTKILIGIKHYPDTISTKIIQIFLDHGATSVNNSNTFHYACRYLNASIVKMMLDHGADLNSKTTSHGFLPIQVAFKSGDADKMNFFLDLIEIDADEINRLNLLHYAARTSIEIVERLLKLGADVNFMNEEGSALEAAVSMGNTDIIKYLLENGANVNLGFRTPLAEAVIYASECDEDEWLEIMELLLQFGANIDGREEDQESPISVAALEGIVKIVKFLLDKGVRQDDRALISAIIEEHVDVVKILLERGYDPNYVDSFSLRVGQPKTALYWAVSRPNERLAKLLLDYGAQVDGGVAVESGKTPLHLSVNYSHFNFNIVKVLLDHGADINKEHKGRTALTMAVYKRAAELCKYLVRHMMLIKAQDLHVSEKNLKACEGREELEEYQRACEGEMDVLKTSKFCDSNVSYLDIFLINDLQKLASLANNQNILRVLKSNNFKKKFPIYGQMIVDRFDKGILRNKDFELLNRFINYLAIRDHDQLPELPFTVVSQIFDCVNDKDFAGMRNL